MIGFQTLYLATNWNPIYWNTACLIVNSGSLEDNSETELVDIKAPEAEDLAEGVTFEDLPDKSGKIRKTTSTDYAKLAKAIGEITSRGIKVSLIDINKSSYSFSPDVENNEILFGLKGVNKVGDPVIKQIIANRPYTGIIDFMNRCPLKKTVMISLIKAGAFDKLDEKWAKKISNIPRMGIMAYYISKVSEPKKKITLQNFNGLIQKNLIPSELSFQRRVFMFNKFLKDNMKIKDFYYLNDSCIKFYEEFFNPDKIDIKNGSCIISKLDWEKQYKKTMDDARTWIQNNQERILEEFNKILFLETWNKYATGSISAWEMESLCFYYHEHELAHVNKNKYGIVNFDELPTQPLVEHYSKRAGHEIPIYFTYRIVGTVIGKKDSRSSISILTESGVVNVKFTKDYYAMFNRQISELQINGKKKIVEKGWFNRGVKVMITGFRRDDMFQAKSYKNTPTHQLYRIDEINEQGDLKLEHERYQES